MKGIFEIADLDDYDSYYDGDYKTQIYKFDLLENGKIKYSSKAKIEGETINQFSLDEFNGNIRVALKTDKGFNITIFDKNMKEIGKTKYLAKGEKMYSSRFMGNKAYLVTYKTVDPLYVIDLSRPENLKVLGELRIPGYSTYLHPYDENYLIGIGMQIKETINRNVWGQVKSTTATIEGMKMALFDVTDVNNPVQISDTVIGDRRVTSAILTNHKALLFSKEKELIAISVKNYEKYFSVESDADLYETLINRYNNYDKEYISEGYFVYNINVKDGFELKGAINYEKEITDSYYGKTSKLLRGLYIDNDLFTISESKIKVNKLEDLSQISELDLIKKEKN